MTSPIPLELQAKIASWRLKAAEGTLTIDEMKEGIIYLRAGRTTAAAAAKSSKKTSVAPPAEDMLSDMEGL